MAQGRFHIKGTKDFLVFGVVLVFLCIWSIRDAWFPTENTLKKHPQRIEVAFEVPGVIKSLPLKVGNAIEGRRLLASLHEGRYQDTLETAEAEFEAAKTAKSSDVQEKLDAVLKARKDVEACTLYNTDRMRVTSHGEESLSGVVIEVMAEPASSVEVMSAESPGEVSEITAKAIFVLQKGSDDPQEYALDGFAAAVDVGDNVIAGSTLAGHPVLAVRPNDTFYSFNKTLAVLSFLGAIVAFIFHGIASR